MSGKRYTEEPKIAAVKKVAERGHPASEVAARLVGEYSQPALHAFADMLDTALMDIVHG